MHDSLAALLRTRRLSLGLSQGEVAARLGVARPMVSKWERGVIQPSPGRMRELAPVLEVPLDTLLSARENSPRSPSWKEPPGRRTRQRGPYPVGATVEQMRRAGGCSEALYQEVLQLAGTDHVRRTVEEFARDTRHELLAAFHALRNGALMVTTSPGRHRCPSLVLDDFEWVYGGDQRQPALLWRGDGEWWLMFGQVRIRGGVRWAYRVDFLLYYKRAGRPGQWMFIELDGFEHKMTPNQDAERAEGLGIPEIRYDNEQTLARGFFARLLRDVRAGAAQGERMARERRKKARKARGQREQEAEGRRAGP